MEKRILQLCCFNNLWGPGYLVESHDIKNGKDVFDLPDNYGINFDLVISAPPCNQFTIANNRNWQPLPALEIDIANKCLQISLEAGRAGKSWILETTVGRIEKLLPELKKFRVVTWQSRQTTKKHTLYSNILLMVPIQKGKVSIIRTRSQTWRESWQPDFIEDLKQTVFCQ